MIEPLLKRQVYERGLVGLPTNLGGEHNLSEHCQPPILQVKTLQIPEVMSLLRVIKSGPANCYY